MSRVRTNNVFGTTTDNPLTAGATTMNSAGLANLAAVSSAEAIITLDPNRVAGAPEIVVVTAHTGSATSATIQRGQFGTSAREHAAGTEWVHGPITTNATSYATAADDQGDFVPMNAWESWTPSLTQSGAVTKTVTYARYVRIGRTIIGRFKLDVTGSGTGSNAIVVGLPVTIVQTANGVIGSGFVYDSSANLFYPYIMRVASTTTVNFQPATEPNASQLGVAVLTAGLASGDIVSGEFVVEAAS